MTEKEERARDTIIFKDMDPVTYFFNWVPHPKVSISSQKTIKL